MARKKKISEKDLAMAEDIKETVPQETFLPKSESVTDSIKDKVDEWKDKQDTETRRNVRNVWIAISIMTLALGYFLGSLFG